MRTSYAWLAGILDGEGCFTLFMKSNWSGNGQKIKSVTANITITNSSAAIMNRCSEILSELGIKFALNTPRASTGRPLQRISVRNYDAILDLLDVVGPFLVGKKGQASLMREFVSRAKAHGGLRGPERDQYYDEMRRLNRFGSLIP